MRTVHWLILSGAVFGMAFGTLSLAHGPKHNPIRHMAMIERGIPEQFSTLTNPFDGEPRAVAEGAALFADQCASCHGPAGNGHSDAGEALDPPAPELKSMMDMPMISDGYLMWTLAEGGEKLETDMPAFAEQLETEQLWKIISYMTAGFPKP